LAYSFENILCLSISLQNLQSRNSSSNTGAGSKFGAYYYCANSQLEKGVIMKVKPAPKPARVTMEFDDRDEKLLESAALKTEPLPIRKILVPLDFSDYSYKSLDYAVAFGGQSRATITLLHVVPLNYIDTDLIAFDFTEIEREAANSAQSRLQKLIDERIGKSIAADFLVRIGRPADEIVSAAKERDSDLIIMSTHGYTGLKHAFLGSTTENVVRYAPCPVLTVRQQEHDFVPPTPRAGMV
jgi:universal stress protein A